MSINGSAVGLIGGGGGYSAVPFAPCQLATMNPQLAALYNLSPDTVPNTRLKIAWTDENRCGFLSGVLQHGLPEHAAEIQRILNASQMERAEKLKSLHNLLEQFEKWYIDPFKQRAAHHGLDDTCTHSSWDDPRSHSDDYHANSHLAFKNTIATRDGEMCMFCWDAGNLNAAHIIPPKNFLPIAQDPDSLFTRTQLQSLHQLQNGLMLCIYCHAAFFRLLAFVDILDDETSGQHRYVARVLPGKHHPGFTEHFRAIRNAYKDKLGREFNMDTDEFPLWFQSDDPSPAALLVHKTACLIWHMAGGSNADIIEEYVFEEEYDDDDRDECGGAGPDVKSSEKRARVENFLTSLVSEHQQVPKEDTIVHINKNDSFH